MRAYMAACAQFLVVVIFLAGSFAKADSADPRDSEAGKTLQRMSDYLAALETFSVRTQTTFEDLMAEKYRVDHEIAAYAVIRRPDKLRVVREGEGKKQICYFNGAELTLHDPEVNVSATAKVEGPIEKMLGFIYTQLGIDLPVSDLLYRDHYHHLVKDVHFAAVIGESNIGGKSCTHLLFSKPGVEFQVWVARGEQPLPLKYVVTDTTTPQHLSISTLMSDWDIHAVADEALFTFSPVAGSTVVEFLPVQ